ncbi:type I pantothenate kinase [Lactobacillus crispatus]|uniref:Pantothenate kinase n=1 Tax=Lactobacillus crispatus TaxID=47770 RepID=A0A4Q0LR94_9LACO|nr:type I pantothenate kinase [Lactobacillus crispatus]MBG0731764.1 type I pantothenate kinase [Lactobacillus crispatus]MCT3534448.1 type I pantothenate kinase [Lactobacillus crispatus]MCT7754717.1 type I pantothenate kinase [Lactobacillus crispatus]MCT7823067.1 type I pantothenate kinase [Lactobacillus crispatus]MDK6304737.1 type I pantothenate kinase [Lactobacillus crispatus]
MLLVQYILICVQNKKMFSKLKTNYIKSADLNQPFILGITGSVAAGKSTTAKVIETLISQFYSDLDVQSLTTDGFIYPNKVLEQKNLMSRKGFPESYNVSLLNDFLSQVSDGVEEVSYPVYSHELSDIVPGKYRSITNPDILILEGIDILQIPENEEKIISDYIDLSIYIDASENLLEEWFLTRFKCLLDINKDNPNNFFYHWAHIPLDESIDYAKKVWRTVNLVNLRDYIVPTKERANIILYKDVGHRVTSIKIRKY